MGGDGEAICSNGEAIVLMRCYEIEIGDGPGPKLDNKENNLFDRFSFFGRFYIC